jgi:hypothetical protein
MMKKIVLSIAAVAALSAGAAPAMAEGRGSNLDHRIDTLKQQIQRGVQRGAISRNEAGPLRDRLRDLTRLERQYGRGGFTRAEQRTVQQRIQALRQQVRAAETNRT